MPVVMLSAVPALQFSELPIAGAWVLDQVPHRDERGTFARAFCQRELADVGVDFVVRQANTAVSERAGTVRGLHVQAPPHHEQKLVRCTRGALVDVVVDLRPESPTYLGTVQVELRGGDGRAVLVPGRCAHGYQSLVDDTEMLYLVSQFHAPIAERGLRWDDPELAIDWPLPVRAISGRDAGWPLLSDQADIIRQEMTRDDTARLS